MEVEAPYLAQASEYDAPHFQMKGISEIRN